VKVRLRNPDREVEIVGGRTVQELLVELGVQPDTALVIRDGELVTRQDRLRGQDEVEIRPVISGGART
jgi:sulfur carrier protein ThiS